MKAWTRSPFAIYWATVAPGWYEVRGWVRDLWGIYERDGWWWVTHLPTGCLLYETIWRRSALRFVLIVEDLCDWGAVQVDDTFDPALVEAVRQARVDAGQWDDRPMVLDTEYDDVLEAR